MTYIFVVYVAPPTLVGVEWPWCCGSALNVIMKLMNGFILQTCLVNLALICNNSATAVFVLKLKQKKM